jgi:hypothetical protein
MYKVDVRGKQLTKLTPKSLGELGILERFDVQEWIEKSPDILGEELLIIAKELPLPSGIRLDLLAIDKKGNLVVIELKRDDSGYNIEWQAIKYASYCSSFLPDDLFSSYAQYLKTDIDDAKLRVEEFIDEELENLNQKQRLLLVAKDFHSDVVSAVLWLREYELEIKCVRLRTYIDEDSDLFITPDIIIPLPEAKDYIERKEVKQKVSKNPLRSSFSLEKGNFDSEELGHRLKATFSRQSDLIPRFICFLEILLSEDRAFGRNEVRQKLFEKGIGSDIGQSGRYLSNLSQFLTKKSNPHLRQMIEFDSGGEHGEVKDNYRILPQYRDLIHTSILEWRQTYFQQ